jgi:3-methyladenine DNA glycosylase AlkD
MKFSENIETKLKELEDKKYLEFSKSTGVANGESKEALGIRIPILRNFAKELIKEYELDYLLNNINESYYEEVMLKGMLITSKKNLEWDSLEEYIRYYVPKITDWALCDTFCSGLKISKKYLDEIWELIKEYLKSDKEFEVRFALVMILNYFLAEEYIDKVFEIINNVKLDKYYVKMANAWLISYCAINHYDKTYKFMMNNTKLDIWTHNKGIQKSIESYRLTKEQKEKLRKLKR